MKPRPGSERRLTFRVCQILWVAIFLHGVSAHPVPYQRYSVQEHVPAILTPQQAIPHPHNVGLSPLTRQPAPCDCTSPVQSPRREKTPHPVFFPYTVPIPWPTPFNGTDFAPIPEATHAVIPTIPTSPNDDTYPLYIPVPRFEYVPVYYNAPRTVKPRQPKKVAIPENPQPIPCEPTPQEVQTTPPENPTIPINSEPCPPPPESIPKEQIPCPVSPPPVSPIPFDPAPVIPAPVCPTPVSPAPVSPTPVSPSPVSPAPVCPAPANEAHLNSNLPREPSEPSQIGSLKPHPQPVGYPVPGHPVKNPHPTLNPFTQPVHVWTTHHDTFVDHHSSYPPIHHTTYQQIHHPPYPQSHPTPYPQIHPTTYPQIHPTPYPQSHPSPYPLIHPAPYPIHHREPTTHYGYGPESVDHHRVHYPAIPQDRYPDYYIPHPYPHAHGPYHHTSIDRPYFLQPERIPDPYYGHMLNFSIPATKGTSKAPPTPLKDSDKPKVPETTPSEPSPQKPPTTEPSSPQDSSIDTPIPIGGRSSYGGPPQGKKEEDEAYVLYDPEYITMVEGKDGDEIIYDPESITIYDENPFPDQGHPAAPPNPPAMDITPQQA